MWQNTQKTISVTSINAHPSLNNAVIGQPPGVKTLKFAPAELYAAAARTSHLHYINPSALTPEFAMMSTLIGQHVDDTSLDFAILATADNQKDFIGTYFTGVVASALAYLALIADGYVWADHFENLGGGNPAKKTKPDFGFAHPYRPGTALLEAKGTRKGKLKKLINSAKKGYSKQIEPHLGHPVGNQTATHGFGVGSYLSSSKKAELTISYTETGPRSASASASTNHALIQRQGLATAFRLAHSEELSVQIRRGEAGRSEIFFWAFDWMDRQWLTSWPHELSWIHDVFGEQQLRASWRIVTLPHLFSTRLFAIDRDTAEELLEQLSRHRAEAQFTFEPMPENIRRFAREANSAIFPDGLAYIPLQEIKNARLARWTPKARKIM
jgi:hypothetical protein